MKLVPGKFRNLWRLKTPRRKEKEIQVKRLFESYITHL